MKKNITKSRELQRRGSGASDIARKDFMEDFDKGLMTDAEFVGAPQQPATPAPQEQPDEFWAKMSWMLDTKLDSKNGALAKNFNVALAHAECALGTGITAEEERRGR